MIRLSSEQRRQVILDAIKTLAETEGVYNITYDNVAAACEVETSRHTVKHYFKTKTLLHNTAEKLLKPTD